MKHITTALVCLSAVFTSFTYATPTQEDLDRLERMLERMEANTEVMNSIIVDLEKLTK